MNDFLKSVAVVAAIAAPSMAVASMSAGDFAGKSEAEIRTSVEAAGYTVNKIEAEDEGFEVYAEINGIIYELEIGPTGEVSSVEIEDDDEDEID